MCKGKAERPLHSQKYTTRKEQQLRWLKFLHNEKKMEMKKQDK
jgi:hypothetical protein